jgi:hypothetical protein
VAKKRSVTVIAAWIAAGAVVAGALISGVVSLVSKDVTFVDIGGVQLAQSVKELNLVVTHRWRRIDEFLGVLVTWPTLDAPEREQLAGLRDLVRAKHGLHAAALQEGNLVLANERLRDLRSALNDADARISSLRTSHPDIASGLSGQYRHFLQDGVTKEVAYQSRNEGIFDKLKRWLLKN